MAIHAQSHIITVAGGKGGVGKSVFSCNLATAILLELKQPTLLIDLDPRTCGDPGVILGLRPSRTIQDLLTMTSALNNQNLGSILTKHASGLQYLPAVLGPEQPFQVDGALFEKQLSALSQFFKFIVVDTGSTLEDLQYWCVGESSAALVITTPEVLVVNQTKRLLNDFYSRTLPADMFQLVVNKAQPGAIPSATISQTLRKAILAEIPNDERTASAALQKGVPFVVASPQSPMSNAYHEIVRKLAGGILQRTKTLTRPQQPTSSQGGASPAKEASVPARGSGRGKGFTVVDPRTLLKMQIHTELIKEMDLKKGVTDTQGDPQKEAQLRQKTQNMISQITDRLSGGGQARDERSRIIKEVLDEALGLGPLEDLLSDPTVTEIMVNGHNRIFVEKSGKLTLSPFSFTSNSHLRTVIERIVTPLGRRIDEKTPYVDARLRDGSRVNAVIEPLAIDGPALTIRKFAKDPITVDHYVKWGSITASMIEFLKICVEQGLNVIISGGTGSGKTTLLNTLSGFIPVDERIVTVEDAAELQLKQEHVVRLETRPANMEGSGEISIRDLVRNSLRMRPDRIIVGECRDGAALDMLSAMNTGHDGSMTTVHANNPREAVGRLETLCMMAGMELPARAIREQIASAVDLIIQISRLSDGSRKVISITEVVGMQGETVTLQEVFRYKEEGFDKNRKIVGQFQATGLIPTFIENFEQRGVSVPRSLFSPTPSSAPSSSLTAAASSGLSSASVSASSLGSVASSMSSSSSSSSSAAAAEASGMVPVGTGVAGGARSVGPIGVIKPVASRNRPGGSGS